MRLAIIGDTFPPAKNSGAVQLRDLTRELVLQGNDLTVMIPDSSIKGDWEASTFAGAKILRLRAPRIKDVGYARRTVAELAMPFAMLRSLRKSQFAENHYDGIIWYSPSIFFGPLVKALKRKSHCRSYLIIRDIFPEWAADMGLINRGVIFQFLSAIARYQYSVADVIGVQTEGNLAYFGQWADHALGRRLEVLPNWLGQAGADDCPIDLQNTRLRDRKILVYAGNMGIAQNMDAIIDLATEFRNRHDVGFVFVGRGSEVTRLKNLAATRNLSNVLFYDEIDPDQVPNLYNQCHVGIVSLDPRHKSHNIPGKFLTYMQSGIPVLANVNKGNDLISLINEGQVGGACGDGGGEELVLMAERILKWQENDPEMSRRCKQLFAERFSVASVTHNITRHFTA